MEINEIALFAAKLTEYQKKNVISLIIKYLDLNEEISDTKPCSCPRCGSDVRFIRKGFSNGKQRYQCKSCGAKFTFDAGKITAHSHQSPDKWVVAIEDTFNGSSVDDLAFHIGVHHSTAFNIRHKILNALESLISNMDSLGGMIEADETYVLESQKGVKVTHRKARIHGAKASKRGLSDEQICICVATDRDGHMYSKSVNRAKASCDDIMNALDSKITDDSIFMCDGADSYNELIKSHNCKKVELIGHESYDKVYHLNTVNSIHSRIKNLYEHYHGVATKYLNRYLAMFTFIEMSSGISSGEMAMNFMNKIKTMNVYSSIYDLKTANLLMI